MYLEIILLLLLHFTPTVVASLKIRKRLILKKLLPLPAPFQHFRFRFQSLSSKCFRLHKKLTASTASRSLVQNVPSFQSKEIFRLQTAHCCLNQHLFRTNCHDTSLCSKCKVPETVSHLLFVYQNYSTGRNMLKSAAKRLGLNFDLKSILSNKVVYPHRFDILAPPIGLFTMVMAIV